MLFFSKIKNLLEVGSAIELYLHYEENIPVGVSLLYFPENSKIAGTYWWGVKKSYSSQGIATHLVNKMICIAKLRGYKKLVAQCLDTSEGLAEHIGFKKYASLEVFVRELPLSKQQLISK